MWLILQMGFNSPKVIARLVHRLCEWTCRHCSEPSLPSTGGVGTPGIRIARAVCPVCSLCAHMLRLGYAGRIRALQCPVSPVCPVCSPSGRMHVRSRPCVIRAKTVMECVTFREVRHPEPSFSGGTHNAVLWCQLKGAGPPPWRTRARLPSPPSVRPVLMI